MALTDAAVRRLQPGKEHPDGHGLYLAVLPSGKRVFVLRFRRPLSGRPAKLTLGWYDPEGAGLREGKPTLEAPQPLTLADARYLAAEARRLIKLGRDPADERVSHQKKERARRGDTFPEAARQFIKIDAIGRKKNRRWRDTAALLGLVVDKKTGELTTELKAGSIAHQWRDVPISKITTADVLRVTDKYAVRTTAQANNVHAALRRLFNWHVERRMIEDSPLRDVPEPQERVVRDRELDDDELVAFWRASNRVGEPFGALFQLLLVTLARRDELRCMRREELRDDLISLSKQRTKSEREHAIPLTSLARAILDGVSVKEKSPLVFTTNGVRPVSGLSKAKANLDREMLKTLRALARLRRQDPGKVELVPWRLHDLRRTAATRMGDAEGDDEILDEVIERVLNHAPRGVTRRHYNLAKRLPAMRRALEWWSRELLRIVSQPRPESGPRREAAS